MRDELWYDWCIVRIGVNYKGDRALEIKRVVL